MPSPPPDPARLTVATDGRLAGATGSYTKRLGDMEGVYRDRTAYAEQLAARGPDAVVYTVQEQRDVEDDGALIIGTSTLLPGRYGDEFAVTRGHLHARPNRAELYYCLSGTGVMLVDTVDGRTQALPLSPGEAVHVPGHWVHRSVNTGTEPFVTMFCYPADSGQNYALIEAAQGMASLVVDDGAGGWTTRPNPDHRGYDGGSPC
ncbi:glucose-6-phosphate isomerase family protein [uncultured Serinicoccus sp.]|uniref:glucose-6-phosphate isomerase family protein n=1 Tax=uncultured Serinicoccus sp. TaxID=735514 RepID=UPI00261274D8|nr:glucose-6-phosphate isomerase family protein [uncultured Serinicoccus sp.]